MNSDLEIPFERITYRDGQLLTALDLEDDRLRNARLQRLHTRYLHDTWGIAFGLDVDVDPSGDAAVQVGPGYALDAMGNPIVLTESVRLALPTGAPDQHWVLAVSHERDAAFRVRQDLASVCPGSSLLSRRERPHFVWRRPDDVLFGPEVPIAQLFPAHGALAERLDLRVRRYARPLARPHIGRGLTERGRTGWRLPNTGGAEGSLEVTVDTSETGFVGQPYYFAALQGDFGQSSWNDIVRNRNPVSFPGHNGYITSAQTDRFVYQVVPRGDKTFAPEDVEKRGWRISWLGIEPLTGCELVQASVASPWITAHLALIITAGPIVT